MLMERDPVFQSAWPAGRQGLSSGERLACWRWRCFGRDRASGKTGGMGRGPLAAPRGDLRPIFGHARRLMERRTGMTLDNQGKGVTMLIRNKLKGRSLIGVAPAFAAAAVLALPAAVAAKEWKTVTIALEGAYEPWNLTNPDGSLAGFEPELAKDVCARAKI